MTEATRQHSSGHAGAGFASVAQADCGVAFGLTPWRLARGWRGSHKTDSAGIPRAFRFDDVTLGAVGSLILAGSEWLQSVGTNVGWTQAQAAVALAFPFALKSSIVKAPPRIATSATLNMPV